MINFSPLTSLRVISTCLIVVGAAMYLEGHIAREGLKVAAITAAAFGFLGAASLLLSFFPKIKARLHRNRFAPNSAESICRSCGTRFKTKYIQIPACPRCEGKLQAYEKEAVINPDPESPAA